MSEMQERRRRLIRYMLKKEGNLNDFESKYKDSINKKTKMINTFTTRKLEDLLSSSTKNVA